MKRAVSPWLGLWLWLEGEVRKASDASLALRPSPAIFFSTDDRFFLFFVLVAGEDEDEDEDDEEDDEEDGQSIGPSFSAS